MSNFKLKLNPISKIEKDHGLDKGGKVTTFLRDTCDKYMDAYIPMQSGMLKNTKVYMDNHSITYVSPYAHYMYKGKVAVGPSRPKGVKRKISGIPITYHRGAPKRGAEWDKRMLADKKNTIIKDIERFVKG